MSIRQRLAYSFLCILLLFAINQAADIWGAGVRDRSMQTLDRARTRQLILAALRQDLDNLHKQITLENQVQGSASPSVFSRQDQQIFFGKLRQITSEITALSELTEVQDRKAVQEFAASYNKLSDDWRGYYENLGVNDASAITHLVRSEQEARRLVTEAIPDLQEMERKNIQEAQAVYKDSLRVTQRMVLLIFILCSIIAVAVGYSLSTHLTRGLNQLKVGAELIGGMKLDHRISMRHHDELTELAGGFNQMAENLFQARTSLVQANRELDDRNQSLIKSESRYRSLVQSAVYGIYRSGAEDRFLDFNPALMKMLGYGSEAQVAALHLSKDVFIDPAECEQLLKDCVRAGVVEGVEVGWKKRDGSPITVRLSGSVVEHPYGQPYIMEMIAEDVTLRRALEDQLRQSQKMEAVGKLAGGIAHDFNNLMTVIKGHAELILSDLRPNDAMRPDVVEIEAAADRAASLTRQLLAFSRKQVLAPKVLDLNDIVSNMQKLLQRLLGENIDLNTHLDANLGKLKADPSQIEQVIMNLAVNARDAMPRGGKLTLQTFNAQWSDSLAREHVNLDPGGYVVLEVIDTGCGMDAATRSRIFEPFFTTKEQGKGTGLGLSTAYGIALQSDGELSVQSEVGRGTTFRLYLPRVDGPAEVAPPLPQSAESYQGTGTVLVVEDEEGVLQLVCTILQRKGYTVLPARNDQEATRLCQDHKTPIGLLLTDVILKETNGYDLSQKLLQVRPEMKVLFMSGYTDDAIGHHGVLNATTYFIHKPFTMAALGNKVKQVLEVVGQS